MKRGMTVKIEFSKLEKARIRTGDIPFDIWMHLGNGKLFTVRV